MAIPKNWINGYSQHLTHILKVGGGAEACQGKPVLLPSNNGLIAVTLSNKGRFAKSNFFENVRKEYLVRPKIVRNFVAQTASQKPGQGQAGGSADIIRKRLSALILDVSEFSQNSFRCQGLSNGRCPRICNFSCFRQCLSREIWPDAMIAYTSVGFCVAVQHLKGNARSLET